MESFVEELKKKLNISNTDLDTSSETNKGQFSLNENSSDTEKPFGERYIDYIAV